MKNKQSTLAIVQRTSGGNAHYRRLRERHFGWVKKLEEFVERRKQEQALFTAAMASHDTQKTVEAEVQRVEPYRTAEFNPLVEGYEDYRVRMARERQAAKNRVSYDQDSSLEDALDLYFGRIASESQAAKILAPRRSLPVRIFSAIWRGMKWLFGATPIDYGNLLPPDRPLDR